MNGEQRKKSGMGATLEAESEDYKTAYINLATLFFNRVPVGGEFSGDGLHRWLDAECPLQPRSPNTKSAMFNVFIRPLLKQGWVTEAGFRKAVRASSHARYCRVYRKEAA